MDGMHHINATGLTVCILDSNNQRVITMPPAELKKPPYEQLVRVDAGVVIFEGNGVGVPIIGWRSLDPPVLPEPSEKIDYIVLPDLAATVRSTGRTTDDLLLPYEPRFDIREGTVTFQYFTHA